MSSDDSFDKVYDKDSRYRRNATRQAIYSSLVRVARMGDDYRGSIRGRKRNWIANSSCYRAIFSFLDFFGAWITVEPFVTSVLPNAKTVNRFVLWSGTLLVAAIPFYIDIVLE
jgi:hypothetical protein